MRLTRNNGYDSLALEIKDEKVTLIFRGETVMSVYTRGRDRIHDIRQQLIALSRELEGFSATDVVSLVVAAMLKLGETTILDFHGSILCIQGNILAGVTNSETGEEV